MPSIWCLKLFEPPVMTSLATIKINISGGFLDQEINWLSQEL